MDDEYTPLWEGSIEDFVEKHLKPVDDALIDARAKDLIRDGVYPDIAYEMARDEYYNGNKRRNGNRAVTSTAVEKVSTDTYNANLPAPTQNTNSMQMTILPNGKMISRVMNPADAGISYEQAQSENYGELKDKRELSRKEKENKLAVEQARALYIEEEEHKRALKEINDQSGTVNLDTGQFIPAGTSAGNDRQTLLNLLYKFTVDKQIVLENKRRDTDDVVVYMWNEDEFIYFKISLQRLRTEIKEFFYKNGWTESFPATDNKVSEYADMIKTIVAPTLDKSGLKIADGNQTFFPNGYYDIRKGEFIACNTKGIFHTFCIPYDFDENAPDPEKFEEILNQTFDEDENKIQLMY